MEDINVLEIGKTMVHKSHGICTIKEILKIDGLDYYRLIPSFDESMSIFVPLAKENELLRSVLSKNEAEKLISYMCSIDDVIIDDTKERRDAFHKMMLSGNLKDIAYMYFKLSLLKQEKEKQNAKFCLTDSNMLKKLQDMLFNELAVVYNKNTNEIVKYVLQRVGEK